MKVTMNENECIKYPCLMIVEKSGSIYLMTACRKGTKVMQGGTGINSHCSVGTHKDHWISGNMMPFKGSITLEND